MKLSDLKDNNWKIKLDNDILAPEEILVMPESIQNHIMNIDVKESIEMNGIRYFERASTVSFSKVERHQIQKTQGFENPFEQVYVQSKIDNKGRLPLPIRMVLNLFIWIIRTCLFLIGLPIKILAYAITPFTAIITVVLRLLTTLVVFAAIAIPFYQTPEPMFFLGILVLLLIVGIPMLCAENLPDWIMMVGAFISESREFIDYL